MGKCTKIWYHRIKLFLYSPSFQQEKNFFMFDSVHIFKNIRNKWIEDPPKSKKPGCKFTKTNFEIDFYVILNSKKLKNVLTFSTFLKFIKSLKINLL